MNVLIMFNWDFFRFMKDMEGERVDILVCILLMFDIIFWFFFYCLERLWNVGMGKKVFILENFFIINNDMRLDYDFMWRVDEWCFILFMFLISLLFCFLVNVKVDIEMKNLWDDFFVFGIEMIVIKVGR